MSDSTPAAGTPAAPGRAGREPGWELGRFLGVLARQFTDRDRIFALRLAETGLAALQAPPAPAPAVAVIGPTQTGKSSVVNILAGGEFVETSPLAAHTREAGLLAVNTTVGGLSAGATGGLDVRPRAVESDCPSCLIWDTPDFDSNAADDYRQQVAQVCAVADLVVVVLTKEKYADQSVWSVLESIAPLGVRTVLCLNKGDADADLLVPVIRGRLAKGSVLPADTPVVVLPRLPADDPAGTSAPDAVRTFRTTVFERLSRRSAADRQAGLARLVRERWQEWTDPVEAELACQREWVELVAGQSRSFLDRYRSEYIDHARHHDVAQKAILGLLELLEIPALAGPMSRTRRMLTWPLRRLAAAFGAPGDRRRDQELAVLDAALDHYLLSLRSELVARSGPWWRAAEAVLAEREPLLRDGFRQAVNDYREAFQPRIDRLSHELYEQLQRNPLTLNALRAARVSADAGGVVLAIKTGALGLYDALFAPAVVSLTSYLTESAVGQYLAAVIARLKREQLEQVTDLVRAQLERPLQGVQPVGPDLFGVSRDELDRARAQLEALEA